MKVKHPFVGERDFFKSGPTLILLLQASVQLKDIYTTVVTLYVPTNLSGILRFPCGSQWQLTLVLSHGVGNRHGSGNGDMNGNISTAMAMGTATATSTGKHMALAAPGMGTATGTAMITGMVEGMYHIAMTIYSA